MVADAESIGKNKSAYKDTGNLKQVISSILQEQPQHFNSWTKAVACLLISKINEPSLIALLHATALPADDRILSETRAFVISSAS